MTGLRLPQSSLALIEKVRVVRHPLLWSEWLTSIVAPPQVLLVLSLTACGNTLNRR